jgi:hypothetical protein
MGQRSLLSAFLIFLLLLILLIIRCFIIYPVRIPGEKIGTHRVPACRNRRLKGHRMWNKAVDPRMWPYCVDASLSNHLVNQSINRVCLMFTTLSGFVWFQAALFGKSFIADYKTTEFVNMCNQLRVLNAIRSPSVGIPLSYAQYLLQARLLTEYWCIVPFAVLYEIDSCQS